MRWFVSYPILAAGLLFAFDTLFPDAPDQSPRASEFATGSLPEPDPVGAHAAELPSANSRLAAFSPGADRFVAPERPSSSVLDYLARTFSPSEPAQTPSTTIALQPVTVSGWQSAVVREPRPALADAGPKPSPAVSRVALARDIQRELQRVGCYLGEIDGVWGSGSKRAVLVFMDRVNAALPTRDPDVFMLSLLRGQSEPVCGSSCPKGQTLAGSGRCVPSTLMAQAGKAGQPTLHGVPETTVAQASPRPPIGYGRMSIGGPKPDEMDTLTGSWPQPVTTRAPGNFERTAALETTAAEGELVPDPENQPKIMPSSFDTDAAPAPARRNKVYRGKPQRAAPVRNSTYRHVQRLFEHPLGRM